MPRPYNVQTATLVKNASGLGNASLIGSYVTLANTGWQNNSGVVWNGSPPNTILPTTPNTFGSDLPFWYFGYTAEMDTTPILKVVRRHWVDAAIQAQQEANTWSLNFLTAPIDETILGWSGNTMMDPYAVQLQQQRRGALLNAAQTPAAGIQNVWTYNIPAGEYGPYVCQLLSEVQRHLLEPTIDGGVTWSLWTQAEVLAFLNLRISRFLIETQLLRRTVLISVHQGTPNYSLPQEVMEIIRVDLDNMVLVKTEPQAADFGGLSSWPSTEDTPYAYMEQPLPTLTIRLVPTPSADGTLTITYVPNLDELDGSCVHAPIPNIFWWAIKWGLIADMLSKEGEANDPARATAAEGHFGMGVSLAKALFGTTT